jgi:BirA family biotin operon repressor/biotin-[acetyl-CoA-carboxylase] ligase
LNQAARFDAAAFQAGRRGAWGAPLRVLERTASTQDEAAAWALDGGVEGAVVLAEAQDAGRGRWGKAWEGRPGLSLLFTVLIRAWPPSRPAQDRAGTSGQVPDNSSTLPLVLGLAGVQALRGLGLAEAACKWPNDLWWRGRKLGGLLVEQRGPWLLAGCGLNVGQAEGDWPGELKASAVSLALAGLALPREAVLAALLQAWEAAVAHWRTEGLAGFLGEWAQADALAGRDCRLNQGGQAFEARVLGLAADGALRVRGADGMERRLYSAEVEQVRPLGAS